MSAYIWTAVEPRSRVFDARCAAGLVVDDRKTAVVELVEAVDDAADGDAVELGAQLQLESDGSDVVGVLELEVPVHEHTRLGQKRSAPALVQTQTPELVAIEQLIPGEMKGVLCGLPAPRAPLVFP